MYFIIITYKYIKLEEVRQNGPLKEKCEFLKKTFTVATAILYCLMQNHVRSMMKFRKDRKLKGGQVMGIFVARCSQKQEKGYKIH